MCGIAGFWQRSGVELHVGSAELVRMTEALRHRGPDDHGYWVDPHSGICMGHRRLSILDLSVEGRQPMRSASGRYVMTFNGEVYNYAALRSELEDAGDAPVFHGSSDTEVMLACIDAWGLEKAIRKFVGMFAFALWDAHERALVLVRDRLGIKPIYVGALTNGIAFGSELKALTAHSRAAREIDRRALTAYVQRACVPAPLCIYRGVRQLRPGTMLILREPALDAAREVVYWSAVDVAHAGMRDPFEGDEEEATDELEKLLVEAVRLRMISDVALGAFLSGGIDSSTVVALMQSLSSKPVRTFSIGNESAYYDESASAARVAAHLHTNHTTMVVTEQRALETVERLPDVYDEPFADSSQIPTLLVSELARKSVTVAVSGDGGDEVFGGYNRHVWGPRVWRAIRAIPDPVRRESSRWMLARSTAEWDRVFASAGPLLPRIRRPGQQVHKLASVLTVNSVAGMHRALSSLWDPKVVRGYEEVQSTELEQPWRDVSSRFMLIDLMTYLPDDILTKVDRASMATSLEARVPLLDHRVVEFAWRLPRAMKIRGGEGKRILRRILQRYVPRRLVDRPKMGFIVPIGEWLRGPLRPMAEDVLSARVLESCFEVSPILERWKAHVTGRQDHGHQLWAIIMFELWRRRHGATL